MVTDEEIRMKFRRVGCVEGPLKPHTVQCDFYAEFARRVGQKWDPSYQKEWAGRFAEGSEFQHADRTNRKVLLDIMLDGPGGGTSSHLDEETVKEWYRKRFGVK